ncbi:MAG: adenylyl-sulfate kinase [Candidatus Hydrothermarchaeales archaeon]
MSEKGFVIWLTGLPGSGKTTISEALRKYFESQGHKVENLDGDEVRRNLSAGAGFSKEERGRHALRVTYVARLLSRNGVVVIVSLISPYRSFRAKAREMIGDFVEVFVSCPLDVCIERDPKGLYKKALAGEITDLTGLQDPYEEPLTPEITLETHCSTVDDCVEQIVSKLKEMDHI